MSTVQVPAYVPAFRTMESTPSRALTFATNLRAVTVGVKDVQDWAEGLSAPDWEGDTGEAHDHAATRFAIRLDTVEAALDKVVTAADRFEARLTILHSRREPLNTDRTTLNADAAALRTDVETATSSGADPATWEVLQDRGEKLTTRATQVRDDIVTWVAAYDDAEADFIAALTGVDTVEEGEVAAADPGRVDVDPLTDRFNRLSSDPVALGLWWRTLSRAQKQAVMTEHPHMVGNAGGIPARDRDEANRAAIHSDIDHLGERRDDGQLTGAEKDVLANAEHIREAIGEYSNNLDPATGREITHVLVYQPGIHSGDGGVAISFGDPDKADHVSVTIPGLTNETSSTSGNLATLHELHLAALDEGNGSVASLLWLDYDAPSGNPLKPWELTDLGGVALTGKADVGGERLGDFIDGIRASDDGEQAHLTAIGHSYGSTTLGHGLEDGLDVDDAILIGSPGQPVATAEALTDADVWTGSKDNDPVTLLGTGERGGLGALGHDPADDDFGGHRFATGDGELRVESLLDNHTSYFTGESLDNIAHIVTDSDAEVTHQPHRGDEGGGYLTLDELVVAATGASVLDLGTDVGDWLIDHSRLGGIL